MRNTIPSIVILLAFATIAQAADRSLTMFDVIYGSANFQRLDQLKELIKQGTDINAPVGFDRMLLEGEDAATSSRKATSWPLNVAVHQARVDMVKLLLANGAKVHGGELSEAAFQRNPDHALTIATALIQAGADVNSPSESFTALHWAAYRGNIPLVKLLLEQLGIKLDQTSTDGTTALMTAVERGHAEIVDMLIAAGANVKITDKHGETAISLAQKEIEKRQAILSKLKSSPN